MDGCQIVALKLPISRVMKILVNAEKGLSLMEAKISSEVINDISVPAETLPHIYFILCQISQNWQ